MKELSRGQSTYALGHSDQELDRLSLQARLFDPFTRRVLEEAGIREGMRVLDVGSGSGDVAFLAARMVGPGGRVIGTDRAVEAVTRASGRAKAVGLENVEFLQGDPTEMTFDQPFDAVIGRLVLMYYPDPASALRKLSVNLREGGLLVFQEFDITHCRSIPRVPSYERQVEWIRQALLATDARTQLGVELYSIFMAAGLPGPSMRMDAAINGDPEFLAYELLAEVTRSLLPVIEKFKIATAEEVDISTLARRVRDEVVAVKGVAISPALIGAWSATLPAQKMIGEAHTSGTPAFGRNPRLP